MDGVHTANRVMNSDWTDLNISNLNSLAGHSHFEETIFGH